MIYMTTDEWKKISKIIEEEDFYKLAAEIAVKTYDLDISEQELDGAMKDSVIDNKKEAKIEWVIMTLCGEDLELSGTKLQKELFEKKCKEEKEKGSHGGWLGLGEVRRLAEECGISIKITK